MAKKDDRKEIAIKALVSLGIPSCRFLNGPVCDYGINEKRCLRCRKALESSVEIEV